MVTYRQWSFIGYDDVVFFYWIDSTDPFLQFLLS